MDMDKPCHSSSADSPASSLSTSNPNPNLNPSSISSAAVAGGAGGASAASTAASGGDKDQFLRHLHKISHKISKPSSSSSFTRRLPIESSTAGHLLRPPPPPPQAAAAAVGPPLQHQPPVYNINKSDFRDVVQKLTGSPAHHAPPQPPPPIHAPKPASSRLQRIRPPPLAQLTNLPSPMLNPTNPTAALSPLPPLPTCHAAAESPISAYMRFLRGSVPGGVDYDPMQMFPPPSPVDPSAPPPAATAAFGCLPSPTGSGPLGLPLSPTVPGVPSPK